MTDSNDEKRRDEILKRMLKTPPKPHGGNKPLTKSGQKKKGDGPIAKRDRRPRTNQLEAD